MVLIMPLIRANYDNIELRFALRSMAHIADHVVIIGYRPRWLMNVEHIPFTDNPRLIYKELNIYNKVCAALDRYDEFIFANDDHFVMPGFDFNVNYYNGTLGMLNASHGYKVTVQNTIDLLGPDARNFDTHCPIIIRKKYFEVSFKNVYFGKHYGFCMKSVYAANMLGEYEPDHKINSEAFDIAGRKYFSVSDRGLSQKFITMLHNMWPKKSRYE